MSTAASTNDRVCLFRLQILVIDGGTTVVRNIFNQKLPNQLQIVLANERPTIDRLKARKIITQVQYDKLYPQSGQPPNSTDFDITLIICLLRSLPSLGLNPNYTWHIPPQPGDTSLEADLHRLKEFRNEVAHVSSTDVFKQASFPAKWTEIQNVLLRLNSAVKNPLPNLQQTLNNFKQNPLDPAVENRFKAEIKQWEEMERGLELEIKEVKKELKEHVKRSTQEVQQVKTDLEQHVDRSTQVVQQVKKKLEENDERNAQEVKRIRTELEQHVDVVGGLKSKVSVVYQRVEELEHIKGKQAEDEDRKAYEELKKNLTNDLKATYRRDYATIQLSPLIEDEDTSLLKFYVMPDINSVTVKRDGKEEKTKVRFCNIFYKDGDYKTNRNPYKEIYVMADAGLGKTSFSKRLALTWCQSKDPRDEDKDHFSYEEIEILSGFDFVFLVFLRDSSSECSVEDMICNQLFSVLGHKGYEKNLENVLNKERCLIVLDGLDEWSHPSNSIPHRAARETTTVLTTTRPWKLSVGRIKSSQIDQKLEIAGLNETSADELKWSFISHVTGEEDPDILNKKLDEFNSVVEEKSVSDLAVIPILLMFMLCLWCDDRNLGKTLSELYSNFVELLLARTVVKYMNKQTNLPHTPACRPNDIPPCFSENDNCVKFYSLLLSLGELAFHTLFRETKEENTLVFDISVAEQYVSKESLDFCLKTGLLTKTKDRSKLLKQPTKMFFPHKSIQEYFAALYMSSSTNQSSVLETVKSKCKCIKDILEISKILLFVTGINTDMLSLISHELTRIVNEDEITRKYRSSVEQVGFLDFFQHPLLEYQDLLVSCYEEMPQENQASLCFEDVFIEYRCEQEQYRETLRLLTKQNQQNIKSVHIEVGEDEEPYKSAGGVIDYFSLTRLDSLEKIWHHGVSDIAVLLKTSVKCLYLNSVDYPVARHYPKEVTSLNKLEVIDLDRCSFSHSELTEFYNYISRTKCLRKIALYGFECTDHEWPHCPGSRLEFQSQLRTLKLACIPLTEVEINLAILKKCRLEVFYKPCPVFKFINHPTVDSNPPGNTHVSISGVRMAASSFCQLVDVIQNLQQSVVVEINECFIEPEDEFRRQTDRIKTSSQFRILKEDWRYWIFHFRTIRGGQ